MATGTASKRLVSILVFLTIALGLSLLYWWLFVLRERGVLPFDPSSNLMGAARGYGPTLAALVATAAFFGRRGLLELWMRVKKWRVSIGLLALALLGPMAGNLIVLFGAHLAGTEMSLDLESTPLPKLVLIFFFFAVVDGPLGEEIGWRGFLLPRLLESSGPLVASTVVGLIWYLWHLPLYIATGRFEMTLAFLVGYLVNNLSFSFLHTWFFERSGGSVFLAVLFHTAGNYFVFLSITLFPGLDQAPTTRPVYLAVLTLAGLCAGISLWRNPRLVRNGGTH